MYIRLAVAIVAVAVGVSVDPAGQQGRAQTLIAKAKAALGGDARLASVQTFVIKGVIAVGPGASKKYGHFTIHARLPDAFVRYRADSSVSVGGAAVAPTTTSVPHGSVNPTIYTFASRLGFVGPRLIEEPDVKAHQIKDLAPATDEEARRSYLRARREFLPLVLGLFATSFDVSDVQYADASDDEVDVLNELQLSLAMRFDPRTGLPVRVGDWVFEDRRDVAGVKVPFRLLRMQGSRAQETWDVKEFQIDVALPPSVFR